jgi:VCBS repeat-containing protein
LQTAPITENADLTPLILPSEEVISDATTLTSAIATPADVLTNVVAFRSDPRFHDITGKDTTVVVIDTGIDVDHPFFGPDANDDGVDDRIVYQWDFADNDADASDRMGHGSHIASVIGSEDTTYPGVAPDSKLIALKVFKDSGEGNFGYVDQALHWVAAHAADYHISVVNLSLGDGQNWTTSGSHYGIGQDFAALANDGIIVVAAAGNNFFLTQGTQGVSYPAADPNVIGVGAVWTKDFGGPWHWSSGAIDFTTGPDRIASFSQRDAVMTEIFAPGARLTGANQSGGTATMQGTSQSAAYLSGVALLAEDLAQVDLHRALTPQEFTTLVGQTGRRIIDGDDEQDNVVNTGISFPRIDMEQLAEAIVALGDAAPVAANDRYRTVEDKVLVRHAMQGVLVNDSDADNPILTAMLVTAPSHGTLVLNSDGGFMYTPAVDYSGTDSFTYKASDGKLYSNVATVTLTIHHREKKFPSPAHRDDHTDIDDTSTLLAQSFIQQEWVKNFVAGTQSDEVDHEELLIALPL